MPAGTLPEYPAPPGNKNMSVTNIAGPASYTQITTGTPPTGGQVINASSLGLVDLESVMEVSLSDNGQYGVMVIHDSNPLKGTSSIRLLWFTASTGAQVAGATNLSARTVRITAIGH